MSIKELTKHLWEDNFDDEENFVNLYFERVYRDDINYTISHQGEIVAALQAIPFDFKINNNVISTAYLSGICTHKKYRQQGFMKQLLNNTHNILRANGVDATFLIPAEKYLFHIYSKFGYSTIFYKNYKKINILPLYNFKDTISIHELKQNEIEEAFYYFKNKQLKQESGVIFSKNYFEILFDVFSLEKNKIFLAKNENKIVGIAFVSTKGKVYKIFTESKNIETQIFIHISNILNVSEIILKTNDKIIPYGMMLFLNYSKILPEDLTPAVSLMLDE